MINNILKVFYNINKDQSPDKCPHRSVPLGDYKRHNVVFSYGKEIVTAKILLIII